MKQQLIKLGILTYYQLSDKMAKQDFENKLSLTTCRTIFEDGKISKTSEYKLGKFIERYK